MAVKLGAHVYYIISMTTTRTNNLRQFYSKSLHKLVNGSYHTWGWNLVCNFHDNCRLLATTNRLNLGTWYKMRITQHVCKQRQTASGTFSFSPRTPQRIPRILCTNIAHAHTEGAPDRYLRNPSSCYLRVRAAESCCSLLQVHPSVAKKLLGRCFRLVWNMDRRVGFNKVSPYTRLAYFSGGLYYHAIRP